MATDPRTQKRLAVLTARLVQARREYAVRRDRYARALIRWEARVARLEADVEALLDIAASPEEGPRSAPIPRPGGWGRPTRSQHPFPRRVGNVKAWCEREGYGYSAAKLWFRDGPKGRPIPEAAAVLIRQQYGVKLSSWPNGVKR